MLFRCLLAVAGLLVGLVAEPARAGQPPAASSLRACAASTVQLEPSRPAPRHLPALVLAAGAPSMADDGAVARAPVIPSPPARDPARVAPPASVGDVVRQVVLRLDRPPKHV